MPVEPFQGSFAPVASLMGTGNEIQNSFNIPMQQMTLRDMLSQQQLRQAQTAGVNVETQKAQVELDAQKALNAALQKNVTQVPLTRSDSTTAAPPAPAAATATDANSLPVPGYNSSLQLPGTTPVKGAGALKPSKDAVSSSAPVQGAGASSLPGSVGLPDPYGVALDLMKSGHGNLAQTWLKNALDLQKESAENYKTQLANHQATNEAVGKLWQTAMDAWANDTTPDKHIAAEIWNQVSPDLVRYGEIQPGEAFDPNKGHAAYMARAGSDVILQRELGIASKKAETEKTLEEGRRAGEEADQKALTTFAQTAGDNTETWFSAWKNLPAKLRSQISSTYTPDEAARVQQMAISPEERFKVLAPQGEYERDFLPAFAQKLNKTVKDLTPAERMTALGQFAETKADPAMRALHQSLLQAQLGQMPTPDDAKSFADMIQNHQMAPSQLSLAGGFGAAGASIKRMTIAELAKRGVNLEEAEGEYQLAKSPGFQQQIRYMDQVTNSLPRLQETANKLGNTTMKAINDLVNKGKNQFNNVDLKAFKTDVTFVADEVGKILQGGGTGSATSDAKLRQASEVFSSSDSPASIAAAAKEVQALIGSRRQALTKGTYLESSGQTENAKASENGGYGVGQAVKLKNGQTVTIRKVNPDGTYEAD